MKIVFQVRKSKCEWHTDQNLTYESARKEKKREETFGDEKHMNAVFTNTLNFIRMQSAGEASSMTKEQIIRTNIHTHTQSHTDILRAQKRDQNVFNIFLLLSRTVQQFRTHAEFELRFNCTWKLNTGRHFQLEDSISDTKKKPIITIKIRSSAPKKVFIPLESSDFNWTTGRTRSWERKSINPEDFQIN